jgi:hypothetical protein
MRLDATNCPTTAKAQVLSGDVHVVAGNQDARLVWHVKDDTDIWLFRQVGGVVLKSTSPDPSGQFYLKVAGDVNGDPDPTVKTSKRYHWRDVNVTPYGIDNKIPFGYTATLYDGNGNACVADPQVFNDG